MRIGYLSAVLAGVSSALSTIDAEFMNYITLHNKRYSTQGEFIQRKRLFEKSHELIKSHNETNSSFTLGHNKFSDMTKEEKAKYRGRKTGKSPVTGNFQIRAESNGDMAPDSIDWRELGAVNPIKDQGQCGSCWAFSSVACMEGAHFVKTGKLLNLSEQQLVDCAGENYGNYGCNGGWQEAAFTYYEQFDAIAEDDYAYTAKDGTCQFKDKQGTGVNATIYFMVVSKSEVNLREAIAQQPVSVSIEADQDVFGLYQSGIFDSPECGTMLDHAVALVGYGSENGQKYYILRNSWGTDWGEEGYMRIADTGMGEGICGVQIEPLYPVSN